MNNLTGVLTDDQLIAVQEHAEAFACYVIVGQYKNKESEMMLYTKIVAAKWNICYRLCCHRRDEGTDGLLFKEYFKTYLQKFKETGFL